MEVYYCSPLNEIIVKWQLGFLTEHPVVELNALGSWMMELRLELVLWKHFRWTVLMVSLSYRPVSNQRYPCPTEGSGTPPVTGTQEDSLTWVSAHFRIVLVWYEETCSSPRYAGAIDQVIPCFWKHSVSCSIQTHVQLWLVHQAKHVVTNQFIGITFKCMCRRAHAVQTNHHCHCRACTRAPPRGHSECCIDHNTSQKGPFRW